MIVFMHLPAWGRRVLVVLIALGLGGSTRLATSAASGGVAARVPRAQRSSAHHAPVVTGRLSPAPATGAFGLDLMKGLGAGNVVLSPDSIASALAMTGAGAAGETASQMARVLHLTSPAAFPAVGRLQATIAAEQAAAGQGDPQAPTLNIANGLFLQQGFQVLPSYLSGLQTSFGATPQSVDFENYPVAAVQAINAWVSAHTNGIIPHIINSVPEQARLVLANAIYLKAAWLDPFKPSATAPAPFHARAGVVTAPFMHETDALPYGLGRGYAAVELPYLASTLSLLVVLPTGQSVSSLQHRLDAGMLARIARKLTPRPVALSLPRFHVEVHRELNRSLESLGMTLPFSQAADFSRIATDEPLKLGQVEHAADFEVDEQGTLAVAATTVVVEATALEVAPPATVRFDADRPFLFFLRDDRTGAVLFAGRLEDPAAPPA
jgi:serpin B